MKLSVLIRTTPERSAVTKELLKRLLVSYKYTNSFNYDKPVSYTTFTDINNDFEIIVAEDKKELSVGLKAQRLLEKSVGKWIVFLDSDDLPNANYISLILTAIRNNPDIDCMGIWGNMTTDGKNPVTWCHRLGFKIEGNGTHLLDSGHHYERPIIHFNPVLREKALEAGFKDMRFGEDMDYASRLNPLLSKEYFITEPLFHYRYSTKETHKEKYGIK